MRARPIRIGLDMHSVDGIHQGSRTHCLELFSRAARLGTEFTFVAFLAEPERLREEAAGFSLSNVELVTMKHQSSPARLLLQLPLLAQKQRLDLLHTQYIVPPLCPCPTAVTVHDTLFESHPQFFEKAFTYRSKLLVRYSSRKSDLVFTVSGFSRQEMLRRYNLREDRVTNIANGVDLVRFRPGSDGALEVQALGLKPGAYLLTVGRLEPRKNHAGLLNAYSKLARPRPKLVIVGQRDFGYSELFRLVDTLDLKDEVLFFENVDDSLLPALYRHALAFIYPTWAEGFGMPILEAMASGVPVLTSGGTALSEVAGDAAIYLQPEDAASMSRSIMDVISDAELRASLVRRGLARAACFNWEGSASRLIHSYRMYFGNAGDGSGSQ